MCETGTITMWGGVATSVPEGWLVCDGTAVNQTDYPALYEAVGTNFGVQPPPGKFYLPDLRGRFVRGQDVGGKLDPDAAERVDMQDANIVVGPQVGSVQADAFQNHVHPYTMFPSTQGDIASGTYWAQGSANTGPADTSVYRASSETRPVNAYLVFIIKT